MASLLVLSAQADMSVIPRISAESQSYQTDFSSADYVSFGAGISFVAESKLYVDFEFFRNNGEDRIVGEVTREETTLTVGKAISNGLSLFGGYKIARSVGVDETNENANSSSLNEIELDTDGLFVGVSKTFSAGERGMFTLAAAVSPMNARVTTEDLQTGDDIVSEESATGVSLNVAYNHMLTNSLISSVGYKQQSFSYGGDIGSEEVSSLFAKLAYRF